MGLMGNIIRRVLFSKEDLRKMEPRNLTHIQEEYEYLTGNKFVGTKRNLTSKQKKDARNDMDDFMAEKGYRPMHRRIRKTGVIRQKKKLKVGESETVGRAGKMK